MAGMWSGRDAPLRFGQNSATCAAVLVIYCYGEDFEPDAVDVDSGDVLPGLYGDHLAVGVFDKREVASLKRRIGQVVEPGDGVVVDPGLDLVFEGGPGRAAKPGQC